VVGSLYELTGAWLLPLGFLIAAAIVQAIAGLAAADPVTSRTWWRPLKISAMGLREWLLAGWDQQQGPHSRPPTRTAPTAGGRSCASPVSTISRPGYQPASPPSPRARCLHRDTLLVMLTLGGALPIYRRVAHESPHGEGSIAMLEKLKSWWTGKLVVLVLLGFAATDFIITSRFGGRRHRARAGKPFHAKLSGGEKVLITLVLVGCWVRSSSGFREAIGIAVVLVFAYLGLNAIVVTRAMWQVITEPHAHHRLGRHAAHRLFEPDAAMIAVSLLVFPKLALACRLRDRGRGHASDQGQPPATDQGHAPPAHDGRPHHERLPAPEQLRDHGAHPAREFEPGGSANGRALASLRTNTSGTRSGRSTT
jgi:hypothetical protein